MTDDLARLREAAARGDRDAQDQLVELAGRTQRDTQHHKQFVTESYSGMKWRVPELLERVRDSEDLY